jgi:hypothetical protein
VAYAEGNAIRLLSDVPPAALAERLAAADDATARRLAETPGAPAELLAAATIDASLAAADVVGGTAPHRVAAAIAAARTRIEAEIAARSGSGAGDARG